MNPFSGFLQPTYRPLEFPSLQNVVNNGFRRREMNQHALENEQQNARANAAMKLQQDYQARKFSKEDQAEVEGLLAEYQAAEDQGDDEGLSRAAQKLQRFGMQVDGGSAPAASSDLRAHTGERALPLRPTPAKANAFTGKTADRTLPTNPTTEEAMAFTGKPGNPIDDAVSTELKNREMLRAKNAQAGQGDRDLSQEDFENELIESQPLPPERYESTGDGTSAPGTTKEFKSRLDAYAGVSAKPMYDDQGNLLSDSDAAALRGPIDDLGSLDEPDTAQQAHEPEDLGDVDDSAFKADAKAEGETTRLSPEQEAQFQAWAKRNGIRDANSPESHYDYRGFFIQSGGATHRQGDHFPDTFKQHGHETFSEESQYSSGPGDGGKWDGETFIPSQGAAQANPVARGLPTQLLPRRGMTISKNGQRLYQSTGPSGRWSPMVQSVFEPYTRHQNPEIAAAAQMASQQAEKLIHVDGISPKEAIDMAAKGFQAEAGRIVGLERTTIGSKGRRVGGGGGGGGGLMGKAQDIAESPRVYDAAARDQAKKIMDEDSQYASMEENLNSGDPALQRNAINELYKIRAGTAVSAAEDARVGGIVSMIDKWRNKVQQWTGGPISPEMLQAMQQIVLTKRRVNSERVNWIYNHQADLYEAQNEGKVKDQKVLKRRADMIRKGSGVMGSSSPSDEPREKTEEELLSGD